MNRPLCLASSLVVLAGVAAAAPALKGKDEKSDLKKFEGDWAVESWVQSGQNFPMRASWSFKGDKYTLDQGGNVEEGTIKLDEAKKPAAIDLDITVGSCQGKQQPGIYKFDGDTLVCCFAWPGTPDRPTEFASSAANRFILVTLKKVKK